MTHAAFRLSRQSLLMIIPLAVTSLSLLSACASAPPPSAELAVGTAAVERAIGAAAAEAEADATLAETQSRSARSGPALNHRAEVYIAENDQPVKQHR